MSFSTDSLIYTSELLLPSFTAQLSDARTCKLGVNLLWMMSLFGLIHVKHLIKALWANEQGRSRYFYTQEVRLVLPRADVNLHPYLSGSMIFNGPVVVNAN